MGDRRSLSAVDAARRILDRRGAGRPVALLLTLEGEEGKESAAPGRRLLVEPESVEGTLGEESLDRAATELGRKALHGAISAGASKSAEPFSRTERRTIPREGVHTLRGTHGEVRIYLELHLPQSELLIVGAGHIARPLCTVGALLDFRVVVLDDRPRFASRERFPEAEEVARVDFSDPFSHVSVGSWSHVVLITRGHRYDYECLRRLLRTEPQPSYIGMIGSRRRVRATYVQLRDEGIERERLEGIHAPVGLDLGAQTPEEIAVSVAAELILHRRGGSGRPLRDVEEVARRFLDE